MVDAEKALEQAPGNNNYEKELALAQRLFGVGLLKQNNDYELMAAAIAANYVGVESLKPLIRRTFIERVVENIQTLSKELQTNVDALHAMGNLPADIANTLVKINREIRVVFPGFDQNATTKLPDDFMQYYKAACECLNILSSIQIFMKNPAMATLSTQQDSNGLMLGRVQAVLAVLTGTSDESQRLHKSITDAVPGVTPKDFLQRVIDMFGATADFTVEKLRLLVPKQS